MQVRESVAEWLARRRELSGRSIGFVPTMGALHAGHASLVERCRKENDIVVVSVFVNPLQFNDPSDLERYPRTWDHDLALLKSLGTDEVIAPTASEMYPNGFRFRMEPDSSTAIMEGAYRPGFLQGVLTVVLKLLNLAGADRAYFGEKDFQQLRVVTEMVQEFFIPTTIIPCPTLREPSGLAMSSRNTLLSSEAHARAADLYRALTHGPTTLDAREQLEAAGFVVEYVEEHWGRRLAAVWLDGIRLIDNIAMTEIQPR